MVSRRLAVPALLLGGMALVVSVAVGTATDLVGRDELVWLLAGATFLASAAYVRYRIPEHPLASWFALVGGLVGLVQAGDGLLPTLAARPDSGYILAWVALAYHLGTAAAVIAFAHLLGLFPDGQVQRPYEARLLRVLWSLLAVPPVAFLAHPTVVLPAYHLVPDVANPYHVAFLSPLGTPAAGALALLQGVFVLGLVLLAIRYRRAGRDDRRRIRWLLLPALLAAFTAIVDLVALNTATTAVPDVVVHALWIVSIGALPLAIAVALLRPDLLDVDLVLKRSLVYGALWSLIAAAYVGAAAGFGLAAGQRMPVGLAILLTVTATLVFQPARRRLEQLADRWVFGARTDPARLVARLGETLAETFDLESLLPRIATTVQQGLGVRWARVRLSEGAGDAPPEGHAGAHPDKGELPTLAVPVVLGDEVLGTVECGPKEIGAISAEDAELVTTLARQAALAVRNVRLAAELGERLSQVREQADELARSRARLVRAQEAERRRIERNIHDGVQQDLVALIGQLGHARSQLERDPSAGQHLLVDLQDRLRHVIGDLRELAHGIHPTLLSDRGLLEAVEALAARSPVPVAVRADPSLRGLRFPEEVEGAGYFTVAECLANVLKHAAAKQADVSLGRFNGSLHIEVRDDGCGFDPAAATGAGLANLAERLAALGGVLEVSSEPGAGTTVKARVAVGQSGNGRG